MNRATSHPPSRLAALAGLALACAALAAPSLARAEAVVGLTTTNALLTFDSTTPLSGTTPVAITGLVAPGESIVGIDLRPATGTLYGLSNAGRLYVLNGATGAATLASTLSSSLSGSSFGMDFNPTVDRLRITSNAGLNYRVNVDTGAVTVDTPLNGATSNIVGSAYTNNFAGATSTALYGISAASDTLYLQNPPNNGTLTAIGGLGVDTTGVVGFDISGATGAAFASLTDGDTGDSAFYGINLVTGAATLIGAIGYGGNAAIAAPLLDITVAAVPEPGTTAMLFAGLLAVAGIARRRNA